MDQAIIIHTGTTNSGFLVYDDGCHLRCYMYAMNPSRKDLTPTMKKLADMEIVVDKMHMKGHTDQWCRLTCDPHKFRDFHKVSFNML